MEKLVVEKICRKCKWYEKFIMKVLKKLVFKIYNIVRVDLINSILNQKSMQ